LRLLMVGGDRRSLMLEPLLRQDGHEVHTLGLHADDERNMDIQWAEALIFPYPFAVKNGLVPALSGITLHAEDVLQRAEDGVRILAGKGIEPYALTAEMLHKKFRLLRYGDDELLSQQNADLSAEAALCEAMQRTERALPDMKVLVVGYGLFGRSLARRLRLLGAEVWIAARRMEQRLLASGDGMHAVAIREIENLMPETDMVLNTVPAQVIGERAMERLRRGSWMLELASAPYGFDRETAAAMGIQCEVLPALPARYAPMSAALALKTATDRLLEEGKG